MSTGKGAVALEDVVGSVLDTSTGVKATCLLPLLHNKAALIGTNKGSVLFCTSSCDAPTILQPSSDNVLHCGPIYDLALSSQHLIATAGHDAVACVFPLHMLFRQGGVTQCRRLTGHTVPVVAVKFLTDGTTLVMLGADGVVRIVDVVRGDVLAVLATGFAATCVACSVDETTLYVGGRSLAAIDLYPAMRPSSFQASATAEVWSPASSQAQGGTPAAPSTAAGVRLYQWAAPVSASKAQRASEEPSVSHVCQTPRGIVITQLTVDGEDNSLTAVFTQCGSRNAGLVQSCGRARWSSGSGKTADETCWETSETPSVHQQRPLTRTHASHARASRAVSVRCSAKSSTRASAKQQSPPSSSSAPTTANTAAALWHGRWYNSPFELSGEEGVAQIAGEYSVLSGASLTQHDVSNLSLNASASPLTQGEEVAVAEARCDELQRECDALVFQIRSLRSGSA